MIFSQKIHVWYIYLREWLIIVVHLLIISIVSVTFYILIFNIINIRNSTWWFQHIQKMIAEWIWIISPCLKQKNMKKPSLDMVRFNPKFHRPQIWPIWVSRLKVGYSAAYPWEWIACLQDEKTSGKTVKLSAKKSYNGRVSKNLPVSTNKKKGGCRKKHQTEPPLML